MLTSPTYFEGELALGQVEQPDVAARVQWFIREYEPQYLQALLGSAMTDALYAAVEAGNMLFSVKIHENIKKAAAYYVYFHYRRDQASASTGVGEVAQEADNAHRVPMVDKLVRAWNKMADISAAIAADIAQNGQFMLFNPNKKSDIFKKINGFGI
jgi:hypothetical protein